MNLGFPLIHRLERSGAEGLAYSLQSLSIDQLVSMRIHGSQNVHVMISCPIHSQNVSDYFHSILALIVESANKRRHVDWLLRAHGCRVYSGSLILREAECHIDANTLFH